MSLPATTAHCNQSAGERGVLRAADLDVWVAYDGGVVTLRPGTSSVETDSASYDMIFHPEFPLIT